MSPDRQRQVLRDALNAFDQAIAVAQTKPALAEQLYRNAAAGFEALLQSGLNNPALEYNLGNTYFRLGQLGRAILHYRRAHQLDPADKKLSSNLDYARRQVEPNIRPSGETRLLQDLLFLHYRTSLPQRFWAAALLSALGWLLLIIRLRWPSRPPLVAGIILILLGLSFSASAVWQTNDQTKRPSAVVVEDDVILRLGRGEGSDAALKQPLGPGVELRVLQQRGDWVEVHLQNNQAGWLPASAVQRI
jgi:tetratricopeptide (TPR) repeat protein